MLSDRPKLLFDYFKQCFAQVTNPPIDPIREELVMSLVSLIGPRPNLLELEGAGSRHRLETRQPIISNLDLERIRQIENHVDQALGHIPLALPILKQRALWVWTRQFNVFSTKQKRP